MEPIKKKWRLHCIRTTDLIHSIFSQQSKVSIFTLPFFTVKPRVIEMPRVRILGKLTDTSLRQFPISTVLQLTCEGQIGNDTSKVSPAIL